MTPIDTPKADLSALTLLAGRHNACPALAGFGRRLHDLRWPSDKARTAALLPVLPLLVGSRSTRAVMERRAFFFADRAVRELAPMSIDSRADLREKAGRHDVASKLREVARKLRAVPEIVDIASARAASEVARGLREALRDDYRKWRAASAASASAADAAAAAVFAAAADAASASAAASAADAVFAAADDAVFAADAAASAADAARLSVLRRAAAILAEAARITAAPGAACGDSSQQPGAGGAS